jgi:hypothetical protein
VTRAAAHVAKRSEKNPQPSRHPVAGSVCCFLVVQRLLGQLKISPPSQGIQRIAREFLENSGGNFLSFLLKSQRAHGIFPFR